MEFSYRGFSAQMQRNQIYCAPSSSSPNYANVSVHALEGGLWSGRRVDGESEFFRELERKRIREEILAEEEHKRVLEAEIRREYMIEQEMRGMYRGGGLLPSSSSIMLGHPDHYNDRFQPRLLHGQLGQAHPPADRRTEIPAREDYGGIRRQPGELVAVDVVPLQQRPVVNKGIIGLDKPYVPTTSGTKRKQPPPPSPPLAGSPNLSNSSKKKMTELTCALCKVSATSDRGLQDHFAGKKHQAKAAGLKTNPTTETGKLAVIIKNSPESVQIINSTENKKPKGECSGEKFKFWCRMCRYGASNKKEMNMHKKGTAHLKKQLNRAQQSRRKTRRVVKKM